jgi:hypothetical protein
VNEVIDHLSLPTIGAQRKEAPVTISRLDLAAVGPQGGSHRQEVDEDEGMPLLKMRRSHRRLWCTVAAASPVPWPLPHPVHLGHCLSSAMASTYRAHWSPPSPVCRGYCIPCAMAATTPCAPLPPPPVRLGCRLPSALATACQALWSPPPPTECIGHVPPPVCHGHRRLQSAVAFAHRADALLDGEKRSREGESEREEAGRRKKRRLLGVKGGLGLGQSGEGWILYVLRSFLGCNVWKYLGCYLDQRLETFSDR